MTKSVRRVEGFFALKPRPSSVVCSLVEVDVEGSMSVAVLSIIVVSVVDGVVVGESIVVVVGIEVSSSI